MKMANEGKKNIKKNWSVLELVLCMNEWMNAWGNIFCTFQESTDDCLFFLNEQKKKRFRSRLQLQDSPYIHRR